MKHLGLTMALLILVTSCKSEQQNKSKEQNNKEQMETGIKLSNKAKVGALLKSMETRNQIPASYINPEKYIQHNLAVADGLAGFGAVLQNAPEGGFKVSTVRLFEDGDYVFSQTEYDFYGPKIGFDVFRFEEGLIVEHWDNLIEIKPLNPSGHTQIDGTTTITDLDKTEANKTQVESFLNTVLINGKMDKLQNYFDGDNYIQHNPNIADGLSGFGQALEAMAKQGIHMEFETVHKVLGQGNFVLTISEGRFAGEPTSYYDLFRLENGKIVEHWDVIETILPEANRKNTNGKFNF
ncbi:nuclear transport factor 2 family protein [Winogradskyella litoriviva]|uniref:Nuclear transport factor 2 family protein n=1 Tax=Winogradskyella litoriviva TaxID=1220182 RepID=A0ABX2E588_9FLAO|nr:nuclear transport factor 2 family protein [Winogradskyella litoriviva]NRD23654.1 nuclear transport factor 2 family protein [Winogradskyella litoriviva]